MSSTCSRCGAAADPGTQCPACGAPVEEAPVLELDLEAAARPKPAGVEDASCATVGGSEGADPIAPLELDRPGPAIAPRPRLPDRRSFAERERAVRVDTWRLTRIPVLVLLGWFTASHLVFGSTWVFIDNVNLLLHEGGHVLFSWAGDALHALGGTLGQLMFPAAFAAYFFFGRRERFAAVACVWWFGENFIGIARYMNDAAPQELPLVGGSVHDWNFLLRRWDLLPHANEIASAVWYLGAAIMLGTLALLLYWTVRPAQRELEDRFD